MTKPRHTTDGEPPEDGCWDAPAPKPAREDGMHGAYWVLPEAERAKGFVRPLRRSYKHVGPPTTKHPLRDLTAEEAVRYAEFGYVAFENYPEDGAVTGRYWTQEQLDRVEAGGCGAVTTMGLSIAETYARDPGYYSQTFCATCRRHLPVGAAGEFVWDDGSGERVGT